jgi:hypothetical protein
MADELFEQGASCSHSAASCASPTRPHKAPKTSIFSVAQQPRQSDFARVDGMASSSRVDKNVRIG